jgi:methionyl aminopeptidase
MIKLKSPAEIEGIRKAGAVLARTIRETTPLVRPGVTTLELDAFVRRHIETMGARPAQLGYMGFPASLCASVNDQVIHGIPSHRRLEEGDIIDLDIVVDLAGYHADACVSLPVGEVSDERARLLRVARECLYLGVAQAVAGNRIGDISRAIYDHARADGFDLVRQFCGHGVGFGVHEDPQIPNYPSKGPNPRIKPGMILAIEPMVNAGGWEVEVLSDNWTVVTRDGSDSAHFEHTVGVYEDHSDILTPWDQLEMPEEAVG